MNKEENHKIIKVICIRHGKSTHSNVNRLHKDSNLVDIGIKQATDLCNDESFQKQKNEVELIVVSPLLRTLQTADIVFTGSTVPIIALDEIMEFPQGSNTPNKRKKRSELKAIYDHISFNINEFQKEYGKEETDNELQDRINCFKNWTYNQNVNCIAFVGHNSFLKEFLKVKDDITHCKHIVHLLKKIKVSVNKD